MPPEGADLAKWYPNHGTLNAEFGVGSKAERSGTVISNKPSVKAGVNTAAGVCTYCINISFEAAIIVGGKVDINIGFK